MRSATVHIDSTNHALVNVELQGVHGITLYATLTASEAENLIKDLRSAIDKANSHNRNKNRRPFP